MKSEETWSERIPGKDNFDNTVFDLAFSPDGQQLLVAVGSRILVYNAQNGEPRESLKGHNDYVYCVAYSKDGKRFASGGADKTIIIWTNRCEGKLKYNHTDTIQCLAYNPVTQQLASGTASDFGLWSPEQKSVQKYKVTAKVMSCSWTPDGQYLALGQFNGHVSIRDKQGNEKARIERKAPISCVMWSPVPLEGIDVVAVGCWDQTLSFYQLLGKQHGRDRVLGYDPCSLAYFGEGEYLLIGGSSKEVNMHTKDGVFLKAVAERDDWIWKIAARPKQSYFAVGCNSGTVSMGQLIFTTVHGLYQDRYAHRDTMTDVIIQHLITEQKVRIKTRDYVKKIAVYRARLAVQLPDRVLIYESTLEDPYDMHYKLKQKILQKIECNLLVVTSTNIILCQEKRLQLYNFKGVKVREWVLEAVIRYIRVAGGPMGREGLLVGLKNGAILKIFVDNQFPVSLIRHSAPVRCLDLSMSRNQLAVVDEDSKVYVYDVLTQEVTFEETNANSVAWNTEMEDMLCYSGAGQLIIKTSSFPLHKQTLQGFVVGFKGSKIFCLHYLSMQTIDVPQSASMYRYLDAKDFENAYRVACLGVTETDWRELALRSLSGLSFSIARKAFIRLRDVRFIELLNRIEMARALPDHDDNVFLADILAFQGKFNEAARMYVKAGQRKKAIEMFLDLRDWERAKELVDNTEGLDGDEAGVNMLSLLKHQARWMEEVNDFKGAAEMYWAAKDYGAAIRIMGENAWYDMLMERARSLHKLQHQQFLQQAVEYFRKAGLNAYCQEIYLKLDDYASLLALYVEQNRWDEAFLLAKSHPQFAKDIYFPYAEWLAIHDRFDEAQQAFKEAGRPMESLKMLNQLTHNAIVEHRFNDAGYYYFLLALEAVKHVKSKDVNTLSGEEKRRLTQYRKYMRMADLYQAYHTVHRYTDEPFTSILPEALFQTSQYLLNNIKSNQVPFGISKVYSLYALAKQGKALGAYKLARQAFDRLLGLKVSADWRDQIDHACIAIRAKPVVDQEDLLPVCYRCSTSNPLLNTRGDICVNCGHAFVRSFVSFEILPLVRFYLANDITDDEAAVLIARERAKQSKKSRTKPAASARAGEERLVLDDMHGVDDGESDEDDFSRQLMSVDTAAQANGQFPPVVCGRETLLQMHDDEVYIVRPHAPCGEVAYYRSVIPDLPIVLCQTCNHFFHEEDYEFHVLQRKSCPFCRTKVSAADLPADEKQVDEQLA